jgi:excisionase family DNA binding protein
MTKQEFKEWCRQTIAEIRPRIGKSASADYAKIVATAKLHAFDLGMHDLAYSLPDNARVKSPLTVCNQLRRCIAALDQPAPGNPDILSVPELAIETGTSEDTIRGWITSRQLKASNVANGGRPRYLIRRADLDAFFELRQLQPLAPTSRGRRASRDSGDFY